MLSSYNVLALLVKLSASRCKQSDDDSKARALTAPRPGLFWSSETREWRRFRARCNSENMNAMTMKLEGYIVRLTLY